MSPATGNRPLFAYSSMSYRSETDDTSQPAVGHGRFLADVAYPLWKIPVDAVPRSTLNALYDRIADPAQRENLWDREIDLHEAMVRRVRERLAGGEAPAEQLERLSLRR